MKAYTFINSYVCGIQVGIQAGHAIVELMNSYQPMDSSVRAMMEDQNEDLNTELVQEWAESHKTFVWLDGGDSETMGVLALSLHAASMPYAVFREPGLGNVVTAISTVLDTEQCELVDTLLSNRGWFSESGMEGDILLYDRDNKLLGYTDKMSGPIVELVANSRLKSL